MKKLGLMLIMVALVGFCFTPAWAQDEISDASAGKIAQVKWIGGLEFGAARDYPHLHLFENREIYNLGFDPVLGWDTPDLSAVFHLPSGARLLKAKLYAWDGHGGTGVNVRMQIVKENWVTKASDSLILLETDTDDNGPGYTTAEGNVGHNIKNNNNWYHARVTLDNGDRNLSLRLWGVRLYYKLRISQGPDVPTFLDVPTGHNFYDEIEAMSASGITNGCPYPNYCPDDPVTRGQMAAFFARALGLYFSSADGF